MAGHDGAGAQRLDPVDRLPPVVETRERGLAEVQVGAVVDDVAGDDEPIGNVFGPAPPRQQCVG